MKNVNDDHFFPLDPVKYQIIPYGRAVAHPPPHSAERVESVPAYRSARGISNAVPAKSSALAPDCRVRCNRRSSQDHVQPQPSGERSCIGRIQPAIFRFQPIEDAFRCRGSTSICVSKTACDRGVQSGKAGFPLVDQPDAFAQNLAFRMIAPVATSFETNCSSCCPRSALIITGSPIAMEDRVLSTVDKAKTLYHGLPTPKAALATPRPSLVQQL